MRRTIVPTIQTELVISVNHVSVGFSVIHRRRIQIFHASIVPMAIAPIRRTVLIKFLRLFRHLPCLRRIKARPFPISRRIQSFLPFHMPMFQDFLFKRRFKTNTRRFPRITRIKRLRRIIFFLPRICRVLHNRYRFYLVRIRSVLRCDL